MCILYDGMDFDLYDTDEDSNEEFLLKMSIEFEEGRFICDKTFQG